MIPASSPPPPSPPPLQEQPPPAPPEEQASPEPDSAAENSSQNPPPLPPEIAAVPEIVGQQGVRTVDALRRHTCPKCAAKGEWNPRKQLLICPYCGHEFPALAEAEESYGYDPEHVIVEHPLLETLEQLGERALAPGERHRLVHCKQCDAKLERTGSRIQSSCDFCGSPELVEYEDSGEWIKPESLLPLKLSKEAAYGIIREWIGGRFWAPNSLKKRSLVDRLHGIYLPYWTFDAHADCPWAADSGEYYWETESYRDAEGRRQTRQVRKVRWTPASGRVKHFFDDVCVAASKGVQQELLHKIEPFPTAELVPYATDYLSGWDVEAYQIALKPAAQEGEGQMIESLRTLCARDIPGDTYRSLRISPSFSEQTWKHILVPIWIVAYQHSGKSYQCLINGFTGRIAGKYPVSWVKVTIAILLGLIAVVLIMLLFTRMM